MKTVKNSKLLRFTIMPVFIISACNISDNSLQIPKKVNTTTVKSSISISGSVSFPEFKIKAVSSDIMPQATVSLIYPPDYPDTNLKNTTVATGLTNESGQFEINTGNNFTPKTAQVYILEATKRLGGSGNAVISLRTNIRWENTTYKSITTPGITINTKTTSLAIISGYGNIPAAETIGTMPVEDGIAQVNDINSETTADLINSVKDLVKEALERNLDPVQAIKYSAGIYYIEENFNPGITFDGCVGENSNCTH